MNDKEKLAALIDKFAGGRQQIFAELIGVPRSNVATWLHRGSITASGREAILDTFPQVSREWLMSGSTTAPVRKSLRDTDSLSMLGEPANTIHFTRRDLIPFFENSRASCSVVEQFDNASYQTEFIHVPGVRARAAIHAEGISMEPSIHEGDICLVGDDVSLADVSPRRIYLIVTTEGHCMFKRIYDEGRNAENILALSENPDYTPHAQAIPKESILHLYPLTYVMHSVE